MWKLTIEQKRMSPIIEDMTITESIEIFDEQIVNLTMMVDKLSRHTGVIETSYHIEEVGE